MQVAVPLLSRACHPDRQQTNRDNDRGEGKGRVRAWTRTRTRTRMMVVWVLRERGDGKEVLGRGGGDDGVCRERVFI